MEQLHCGIREKKQHRGKKGRWKTHEENCGVRAKLEQGKVGVGEVTKATWKPHSSATTKTGRQKCQNLGFNSSGAREDRGLMGMGRNMGNPQIQDSPLIPQKKIKELRSLVRRYRKWEIRGMNLLLVLGVLQNLKDQSSRNKVQGAWVAHLSLCFRLGS